MLGDDKDIVGRFWSEVFNQEKFESFDDFIASDFVLEDIADGRTHDREEFLAGLKAIRHRMPTAEADEVDHWRAENDVVASQLLFRTARKGDADQGDDGESDRMVELSGISISQLKDGKIAWSRVLWQRDPELQGRFFFHWPGWPPF